MESQRVRHDWAIITHWWSILLLSIAAALHLPPQVIWQHHPTVHMFFTLRLWKPRWTETTLSFKYRGSVLCSLAAVSDHIGEDKEADSYSCYTSSHCCKPLILQLKWLPGDLNNQCLELPRWSSGWESTLQLREHEFYPWIGNKDSTCHGATKPSSPNKGSYILQLRPNTDKYRNKYSKKEGESEPLLFYVPFIFLFPTLGSQTLNTSTFKSYFIYREKLESDWICRGEDSGKTWRDLTSIPQVDLLHGDCLQWSKKPKMTIKKKSNSWKKENLISKITILLKSNIQFSTKDHKAYKAWGKYDH